MRKMMLVSLAAAALSVAPLLAEAASLPAMSVPSSDGITLVEGGCGPGGFRAGNGMCYRRPPPRPYYRECPPRMHMSRFGCRPNY